jgi:hypothetical protein
MARSPGFGSTACDCAPCSDSVSLRLPYSVKLATDSKSLTHYTKGTQSPHLQAFCLFGGCAIAARWQTHSTFPSSTFLPKGLEGGASTACTSTVSGSVSLPSPGFFSPFPHGTGSLSVGQEYLALEDGPPIFRQGFSCPALLTFMIGALSRTGLSPSLAGLSRPFR